MAYNPLLQGLTFSQQAQQQYSQAQNQAQGLTQAQLANLAQQQFNSALAQTTNSQQLSGQAWSNWAQQAMNQHLARQQQQFNPNWVERRYQIDGRYMTLQEFVDFIWPEDCADKTFFLLKHTKENKND